MGGGRNVRQFVGVRRFETRSARANRRIKGARAEMFPSITVEIGARGWEAHRWKAEPLDALADDPEYQEDTAERDELLERERDCGSGGRGRRGESRATTGWIWFGFVDPVVGREIGRSTAG